VSQSEPRRTFGITTTTSSLLPFLTRNSPFTRIPPIYSMTDSAMVDSEMTDSRSIIYPQNDFGNGSQTSSGSYPQTGIGRASANEAPAPALKVKSGAKSLKRAHRACRECKRAKLRPLPIDQLSSILITKTGPYYPVRFRLTSYSRSFYRRMQLLRASPQHPNN
jgi:hypothetical protein